MTASHGSSDPVYINETAPAYTPVKYLVNGEYKGYTLDSDTTDPEGNTLAWNISSSYGMEIYKDPQTNLSYIVTGPDTKFDYEEMSLVDYQFSATVFAYEVDACEN